MKINKEEDLFCVDCDKVTRQKFHGKNEYDNELMYICSECGCENYTPIEDDDVNAKE